MEKKVKITLYGGFHGVGAINVMIPDFAYEGLKEGYNTLQDVMTENQHNRLMRHFCGVAGCLCGGYRRAKWEKANRK